MIISNLTIRRGEPGDLPALQQLFVDTVTSVCCHDYNDRQIEAWTSGVENRDRWNDIITSQFLLVASDQQQIVGFCSLANENHVDLLFVHKDYQRRGIANRLYAGIEQQAINLGQKQLSSDVSKTARLFFEKMGFDLITPQTVIRHGIELVNFRMIKDLQQLKRVSVKS